MAASSSGVARPSWSEITETRYCISELLLWYGGRPRGRPLTPATNTPAPIRHRLPDVFRGLPVRQLSTYKRVSMRNDARRAGAVRRPFGMKPAIDPQPAAAKGWAQVSSAATTEPASTASLFPVPDVCRRWLTPVSTLGPGPLQRAGERADRADRDVRVRGAVGDQNARARRHLGRGLDRADRVGGACDLRIPRGEQLRSELLRDLRQQAVGFHLLAGPEL